MIDTPATVVELIILQMKIIMLPLILYGIATMTLFISSCSVATTRSATVATRVFGHPDCSVEIYNKCNFRV